MIVIKTLGEIHPSHLVHSAEDNAWFRTACGAAGRAGSGPPGESCATCEYWDLASPKWSDQGKAAPCLKRRLLTPGKRAQEVPAKMPACNHFAPRQDAAAVTAFADRLLEERICEKQAKIGELEQVIKRLHEEIDEHERERGG